MLTSDCVMAHYNPATPTQVRVDARPVSLGAILTQALQGVVRPVAYASRKLTAVERRYSQTEREALAVVWGCEKFHLYLYGTTFDLLTDHKPLEVICSPTSNPQHELSAVHISPAVLAWCHQPCRYVIASALAKHSALRTEHRRGICPLHYPQCHSKATTLT